MEPIFTAQLARVETPRPRLLPLVGGDDERKALRVVAQIRPRLLHYVQNGELMCVITSCEDIVAMDECRPDPSSGRELRLIVGTAVGNLWLVRLPSTRTGLKPIQLRRFADGSSASARACLVAEVPGVQEICFVDAINAVICTSLILPTTVVRGVTAQRQFKSELEELEGERSTCLVVLSAEIQRAWRGLVNIAHRRESSSILALQGDADGAVRLAVVDVDGAAKSMEELVHLSEPVHSIFPLNDGPAKLIAVGSRGSVAILLEVAMGQRRILRGSLGCSPASISILGGDDESTLVWSPINNKLFVQPIKQLIYCIQTLTTINVEAKCLSEFYTKHDSSQIVNICAIRSWGNYLSVLTEPGRIFCLHRDQVVKNEPVALQTVDADLPTVVRVKQLLGDISTISTASQKMRELSETSDLLLGGLHSALQLLRLGQLRGTESTVGCSLHLSLVNAGFTMQMKRVRVRFTIQLKDTTMVHKLVQSTMWRVAIVVSTQDNRSSSFGFALSECINTERSILLDQGLLQREDGTLRVSCELAFVPYSIEPPRRLKSKFEKRLDRLKSIVIPVIRSRQFDLILLSEPARDFPSNPSRLREHFGQEHVLDDVPRAVHLQGHLWWPKLFHSADRAGISFAKDCAVKVSSAAFNPPLRFVTQTPRDKVTELLLRDDTPSLEQDDVMAFLYRIMAIEDAEAREQWRSACRGNGGKWWIGMRTFAGNLVVLRFDATTAALSATEGGVGSNMEMMDVSIFSASVADLSAMRSLIIQAIAPETATVASVGSGWSQNGITDAFLALSRLEDERKNLAAATLDIRNKTALAGISTPDCIAQEKVEVCQDEVLQLLRRTADVESRTMQLYWKWREVLNQHLTLSP